MYWIIAANIVLAIVVLTLAVALACFFIIFYSPKRKPLAADEYPLPDGKAYAPHREQMIAWIREIRAMEHTDVSITSFDGLKLCGKYYEYQKGAPIEIMFHGYRGTAERDLCGGVYRCFALGRNALIVDQRASGHSEGHVITFGVKESRDCLTWTKYVTEHIDSHAKIILTGISMGAATVMTAATMELPPNVIGILADCGYTSAKDIIKKVSKDMKIPGGLVYFFARLGAKIFGGFDPEASSPIRSMRSYRLPIIFFHGDADDYVPHTMSEQNYAACHSEHKRLVITPNAGHGLCFPVDMEAYFAALKEFFTPLL